MIINKERHPVFSLYYLGGIVLKYLSLGKNFTIDELYNEIQLQIYTSYQIKLPINFFYYTLDWLYIQSLIELNNGRITYVNRKTNNTKNNT